MGDKIIIYMHFWRDPYAELRASWCSIRDVKDILVTSKRGAGKKSTQRNNELVRQVSVMVSKKVTL